MLRAITLSLFLLLGINSFAQDSQNTKVLVDSSGKVSSELTKIFTTKVSLNIDTTVFNKKAGNFYTAEKYNAFVMTLAAPQTMEQVEERFTFETTKNEYKLKEKGKFVTNGKDVLYQKGTMKKDGKKFNTNIYAIKGDDTTTIFITGMYLPEFEKEVDKIIEDAAKTAKLTEVK